MNDDFQNSLLLDGQNSHRRRTKRTVVVNDRVTPLPLISQFVFDRTISHQQKHSWSRFIVKGLLSCQKTICHVLRSSVETKSPHLRFQLPFQPMEAASHLIGRFSRIFEVYRQLIQSIFMEASFNGMHLAPIRSTIPRNAPSRLLEREYLEARTVCGQFQDHTQFHFLRPLQQARGILSPNSPKR